MQTDRLSISCFILITKAQNIEQADAKKAAPSGGYANRHSRFSLTDFFTKGAYKRINCYW
jgi:hypothetical protein